MSRQYERLIVQQQIIPTSRVKRVIEISFEEASRMGHKYVGSEHLLLGLLTEREGIAAHVLQDLGATLGKVRVEIERLSRWAENRRPANRRASTSVQAGDRVKEPLGNWRG